MTFLAGIKRESTPIEWSTLDTPDLGDEAARQMFRTWLQAMCSGGAKVERIEAWEVDTVRTQDAQGVVTTAQRYRRIVDTARLGAKPPGAT